MNRFKTIEKDIRENFDDYTDEQIQEIINYINCNCWCNNCECNQPLTPWDEE